MYMYQRGDIVLVPFPFSDLSSSKTRPAIVVSIPGFEETTGNFIVAMVTSVRHETPYDYEIKRLHLIMKSIHKTCVDTAEKYGTPFNYVNGANIGGFVKVADAMLDQGIV